MDYLLTYKSRFLSAPPIYPKVLAAYMYIPFGFSKYERIHQLNSDLFE